MVQGTASFVGKSLLVAGLCRLFAREGLRVAPFKARTISLNAAVTPEGGEIGVAQAVQAKAAGIAPSVRMNPVLVKPEADGQAQVIVLGRVAGLQTWSSDPRTTGMHTGPARRELWSAITRSLETLRAHYDLVVLEGAGSPAEVNLRSWDLANMRIARYAGAPVVLVGDIDRGGVFASLVGTVALLPPDERALVRGLVINKFRGDPAGLRPGIRVLEGRTRRPVLGVLPYAPEYRLPEEDAVALEALPTAGRRANDGRLDVAIVHPPYISNFDEFSALEREPEVHVRYVRPGEDMSSPDLVILPGSKSTIADLEALRASGLADQVTSLAASGVPVFGICGGYQMLGERIRDPECVESRTPEAAALGLLRVVTTFGRDKRTARVRARVAAWPWGAAGPSLALDGYEIHMGRTVPADRADAPFLRIVSRNGVPCDDPEGIVSADGLVAGTTVHGLFGNAAFRREILAALNARRARPAGGWSTTRLVAAHAHLETILDGLAIMVARHLDLDRLRRITGLSTSDNRAPVARWPSDGQPLVRAPHGPAQDTIIGYGVVKRSRR
jgi:adenosylcobyric acid synthase